MRGPCPQPARSRPSRRCCDDWPLEILSPREGRGSPWSTPRTQKDTRATVFIADSLEWRRQATKSELYSILDRGIPKAHITLPTLGGSLLDTGESVPDTGAQNPGYHLVGMGSQGSPRPDTQKPTELGVRGAQAQRKLEEGFAEVGALARAHLEIATNSAVFHLVIFICCAILSLVLCVIVAWLRLGPGLAAVTAGVVMSGGMYASWARLSHEHFNLVHGIVGKSMEKLPDSFEAIECVVLSPLEELKLVIDTMAKEQRLAIEMGQTKGTKVEVPSPTVLKEPLAGCHTELADSLVAAKWKVSEQKEAILQSSFSIRLPTSKRLWNLCFVVLPFDLLVVANIFIAMGLAYVLVPPATPYDYLERRIEVFSEASHNATLASSLNITTDIAAYAASLMANNHSMSPAAAVAASENHTTASAVGYLKPEAPARMLKGGHGRGRSGNGQTSAKEGPRMFHGVVLLGAPVVLDGAMSMPSPDLFFAYTLPACCQIILSFAQLFALKYLTRRPNIFAFANFSIKAMEAEVNHIINELVGPVTDSVNSQLRLIRLQAEKLFDEMPKIKRCA